MANCVRCGRPAKEGEKLCAACSRQEQGPRLPKSILVTLIVLSLVTIGALAVIVAQLLNAHSQRVSLRLREEALDAREKEYAAVQAAGGDGGRTLGGKADAPHAGGGDILAAKQPLQGGKRKLAEPV